MSEKKAEQFFGTQTEQSAVKAAIVAKYFWAWAQVIKAQIAKGRPKKMGYIDLFCGPGVYDDGSLSTPMIILEKIQSDPALREFMLTLFNDQVPEFVDRLEDEATKRGLLRNLKCPPIFKREPVTADWADKFETMNLVPSLVFLDPLGYKGLTFRLILSLLKGWGSDGIIFFNSNRINAAVSNPKVTGLIDDLFEPARAGQLRADLLSISDEKPEERRERVVETFCTGLRDAGLRFYIPFCFRKTEKLVSHYLVFTSRSYVGYSIMKDIMASQSTNFNSSGGFGFIPSYVRSRLPGIQGDLFEDDWHYAAEDKLVADLPKSKALSGGSFALKKAMEAYETQNAPTAFLQKHYKQAILRLEDKGLVACDPPRDARKRVKGQVTLGEKVVVTFPRL